MTRLLAPTSPRAAWRLPGTVGGWFARPLVYRRSWRIDIAAPVARVWSVLIDFDHYHAWNPVIRGAVGRLQTGEALTLVVRRPDGRTAPEFPTLTCLRPRSELRWAESQLPGLSDSERFFLLQPGPQPDRCVLVHGERHRGLMAWQRAPRDPDADAHVPDLFGLAIRRRAERLHLPTGH